MGVWMFFCCGGCVLSGRGLCDELITRPEESLRVIQKSRECGDPGPLGLSRPPPQKKQTCIYNKQKMKILRRQTLQFCCNSHQHFVLQFCWARKGPAPQHNPVLCRVSVVFSVLVTPVAWVFFLLPYWRCITMFRENILLPSSGWFRPMPK